MGEIADMMLDGTMDPETGEFNFDGEDGPGWPMTAAEAAAWRCAGLDSPRDRRRANRGARQAYDGPTRFSVTKKLRAKVEAFGELRACDFHHWQVRKAGKLVADWWPHKGKFRIAEKTMHGNDGDFVRALLRAADLAREAGE